MKKNISDEYILLVLSKSISSWQGILFFFLCLFSKETKQRYLALKKTKIEFDLNQKSRLQARVGIPEVEKTNQIKFPGQKLAWGTAFSLLILFTINSTLMMKDPYIAKGQNFGVHLFAKGKSVIQIKEGKSYINIGDTLQFYPLSKETSYTAIFGFSKQDGLYKIFPDDHSSMSIINDSILPPALLPDNNLENQLIVISSLSILKKTQLDKIGSELLTDPKNAKILLDKGIYAQIFEVSAK